MKLGKKIFNLRKKKGLSQEELGERVGVTRQTISNWELLETSPNPEQLKLLSKEFNISIDELLDNNVNNIMIQKVSNTEKLAGITLKLLKIIGIIIIIFILVFLIFFILRIRSNIDNNNLEKISIKCNINDKKYTYEVYYDATTRMIKYAGGDAYLAYSANTEKYDYAEEVYYSINTFAKNNNGSCKKYYK